jgi:hypothetical protein
MKLKLGYAICGKSDTVYTGLPVLAYKNKRINGKTLYQSFPVSSTRKTCRAPDSCKNYCCKIIIKLNTESPYDLMSSSHPPPS